ncbi:hypothetical protein [Dickeya chrysanthemi]|uniref:hypothetical protein n=1 Tax=Dickeya chrysanthemi TaxID=556 RepID=UPI0002D2C1C9|nr:hypothetical protein [Dickeya chrysanthemi]
MEQVFTSAMAARYRLILPLENPPGRGIKMMQARRDRVLRPVAMLNEQALSIRIVVNNITIFQFIKTMAIFCHFMWI